MRQGLVRPRQERQVGEHATELLPHRRHRLDGGGLRPGVRQLARQLSLIVAAGLLRERGVAEAAYQRPSAAAGGVFVAPRFGGLVGAGGA